MNATSEAATVGVRFVKHTNRALAAVAALALNITRRTPLKIKTCCPCATAEIAHHEVLSLKTKWGGGIIDTIDAPALPLALFSLCRVWSARYFNKTKQILTLAWLFHVWIVFRLQCVVVRSLTWFHCRDICRDIRPVEAGASAGLTVILPPAKTLDQAGVSFKA